MGVQTAASFDKAPHRDEQRSAAGHNSSPQSQGALTIGNIIRDAGLSNDEFRALL